MSSRSENLRTVVAALRTRVRPLVAPLRAIEPAQRLTRPRAWTLALAAFVIGFGPAVLNAVIFLATRTRGAGYQTWRSVLDPILTSITSTGALVLLAVVIGWNLTGRNPAPWHGLRKELLAGGVLAIPIAISFALLTGTNHLFGLSSTFPLLADTGPNNATDFTGSATAGFAEEPLFTLLIPVVLRASGMRWRWIIATSAVLRVSFHIYYGPGAVWLALWAACSVLVVARTGCIWGVAIMHSVNDVSSSAIAHLTLATAPIAIAGKGLQFGLALAATSAIIDRVTGATKQKDTEHGNTLLTRLRRFTPYRPRAKE